MSLTGHRYLVVAAENDDGYGKAGVQGVYPFATREEAGRFAVALYENNLGHIMGTGGYPGKTYVIDLEDPETLDDPAEMWWWIYEREAEQVYEHPNATADDIESLSPGAKDLVRRWLEEDEDADERTWLHALEEVTE